MMGEAIRVSGNVPDVSDFLKEAMLSQKFADVALCCPGGQRFLAHRLVLSAASPYLQEVLLAHSKAIEYCEPITVILAEIEGPELAAILSFVYTGSATVPRPQLDAFLRAAEALHIRLPPLPVVATNYVRNCKSEEMQDIEIKAKYFQCDQYPSCKGCFENKKNPSYFSSYEGFTENIITTMPYSSANSIKLHSHSLHLDNRTFEPSTFWLGDIERNQRFDTFPSKNIDPSKDHRSSFVPPLVKCLRNPVAKDINSTNQFLRPILNDERTNCTPVKRSVNESIDELDIRLCRSDSYGLKPATDYARNGINNEICNDTLDGIQKEMSFFESRILPSLCCKTINRPFSVNRQSNFVEIGENLTCKENCCRWISPKKHVANQVTASPWKQVLPPHHSPKVRPIVIQNSSEPYEIHEKPQIPSPTNLSRISSAPHSPSKSESSKIDSANHFYNTQVPFTGEKQMACDEEVAKEQPDWLSHEFYSCRISRPVAKPIRPVPVNPKNLQDQLQAPPPLTLRTFPDDEASHFQTNKISQPINQNPSVPYVPRNSKPELSHPISRLCESAQPKESATMHTFHTDSNSNEEMPSSEKSTSVRVPPLSDSNNNESTSINDISQRNRTNSGSAEDLRCDQCGKTFVTRASLKVHSRTHSGEKPFRCADCGKQFSQLRNYKYHRSVHEGTREFAATCPECGKYFNDRGYLSSHMKIHRNRKEYACAECGKSFNQRVAYNMHVRIHTGVKPHQCEQCGKAFSRKMLLKQHLRTHSGERPYQCQVCHKAFADRSNMTLHTRLHSGLKPYQCTLCSKAFTKKHHLKTHLNYHTGTKPYSCPNCGLRFSQSSNMRTHYKKCSVNNPAVASGQIHSQKDHPVSAPKSAIVDLEASKVKVLIQSSARTPVAALTPPNSDQESNLSTPVSRSLSGIDTETT